MIATHRIKAPRWRWSKTRSCFSALVSAAAFATVPSLTYGSDHIVRVLQPFVDRHELAGAVTLVASKDRILSVDAVGYADLAAKKPMSADTLFWIASMSKPILSAALMMLLDEGKVRLDDPVEKYLPHFTPSIMTATSDGRPVQLQKPLHAITVRGLLSHRSGIPFRSSLETPTLDAFPLALRIESYALEPLMFEPGSEFAYSNAGFNTAARIIEVRSGMRYEEFLQQRLFDPLQMKDTTFWPTEAQVARLAKSYKPNAALTELEETPVTQLHYPLSDHAHRYPVPAGGLFSTAADMARFCQMLLSGGTWAGRRYLSPGAITEMSRSQGSLISGFPGYEGYGLGWLTQASGVYGHPGAYGTDMIIDPKRGLILLWMIQHDGFTGNGGKAKAAFEQAAEILFP